VKPTELPRVWEARTGRGGPRERGLQGDAALDVLDLEGPRQRDRGDLLGPSCAGWTS